MKNLLFTLILLCAAQALRADETPMLGLDPGDVTKASVVLEATNSATLELELTPSKQANFTRFTNDNRNKQVSVGFNSVLASRPVLKGVIHGDSLIIAGMSPDNALSYAKALFKHTP